MSEMDGHQGVQPTGGARTRPCLVRSEWRAPYPLVGSMTSPAAGPAHSPWWRANAYVALLLSALVPGAGQIYAGRKRRGYWMLGITAAFGLILLIMLREQTRWLTWSVQPTALRWLLAGNALVLAFRTYAAADAFASLGDPGRRTLATPTALVVGASLIALSMAVVAIPHALAGYYDVVQYDLITTVFGRAPTPGPSAPTGTTPTTPLVPSTVAGSNGALPGVPGSTSRPPQTTGATTTTTIPQRIWDGTERLNVLLLGGDGGRGRTSIRTDTVILASINPATGHTALFSVPRNMAEVPVPEFIEIWDCDCFPGIINALWRWADDRPNRFPDSDEPGAEMLKLAIGELVDLDVHHYALINMGGFVELVDAIGGVEITVPSRVYDPAYTDSDGITREVDIAPGEYHMDGEVALSYARSRKSSDDYNRMGRQRCVLQAVAAQADTVTVIRAFPAIASALKNNLFTDIPLDRLPDFIELVPKVKADEIISVRFVPDRFTGPRTSEGFNTPDLAEIRSVVQEVLALPPGEAIATLALENLEEECR